MDVFELAAHLEGLGEQPARVVVAFDCSGPQSQKDLNALLLGLEPLAHPEVAWFESLRSASIGATGRHLAAFLRQRSGGVVSASLDE